MITILLTGGVAISMPGPQGWKYGILKELRRGDLWSPVTIFERLPVNGQSFSCVRLNGCNPRRTRAGRLYRQRGRGLMGSVW